MSTINICLIPREYTKNVLHTVKYVLNVLSLFNMDLNFKQHKLQSL